MPILFPSALCFFHSPLQILEFLITASGFMTFDRILYCAPSRAIDRDKCNKELFATAYADAPFEALRLFLLDNEIFKKTQYHS